MKLNINQSLANKCRKVATIIASDLHEFVDTHTSVGIERAILRLFGIEGVYTAEDGRDVPLVNIFIDKFKEADGLSFGVSGWLGNAMVKYRLTPQEVAERVAIGKIDVRSGDYIACNEGKLVTIELAKEAVKILNTKRQRKKPLYQEISKKEKPLKYVIVATGNIYSDIDQAKAACSQGADIIAVIRSTAQSLLDYVPYGAITEGIGGTYATRENFRLMREALDEQSKKLGRYISLVNYSSGLCMAEIAVIGAQEELDILLNDAMYGVLFRDINMKRTFLDQYFSRLICSASGIMINTGEDNYLTTADAYENVHQVIASQFINEQLALRAGLVHQQIGLGHVFGIDPEMPDALLFEMAQALLVRQLFPDCPIKYMPPTKHKTGDLFYSHGIDMMFNLTSCLTGQSIHLVGMPSEAVHNPYLQERFWSLKGADYVFRTASQLGAQLSAEKNGAMEARALEVLKEAYNLLEDIQTRGLMTAITEGHFAGISRGEDDGRGAGSVYKKEDTYWNPVLDELIEWVRSNAGESKEDEGLW
jgi:beta-lysine 5,6-aminomutase alpha subunit